MAESTLRKAKAWARRRTPLGLVRKVQRARNELRHAQQRRFDQRHGVDTAGLLRPEEMDVAADTLADGHLYEATWRGSVRRMIRSLDVDVSQYTFIDVGSGKGPVLLYASEYPFRRVIGVEYSRELHDIAVHNIEVFQPSTRVCQDVTAVCADALEYELPDEPTLLFLCNPFEGPTLSRFLDRVHESLQAHPRPLEIISFNTQIEPALNAAPWLRRTGGGWAHSTWSLAAT